MEFLTLEDVALEGKTVLLRTDMNSPMKHHRILDDSRIRESLPTIKHLKETKLVVLAHQSRPGKPDFTPLEEHSRVLSELVGREVRYVDDLFGSRAKEEIERAKPGEILILENVRFYTEELLKKKTLEELCATHMVKHLSKLADLYVNDAFAAAHRAQTSLIGFTKALPCLAGKVMEKEIKMLSKVLNPEKPCIAVLGGAKIEDSIKVAKSFLRQEIVDKILTTGVVANMFLDAKGVNLKNTNIKFLQKEYDYPTLSKEVKDLVGRFGEKIATPIDLAVNNKGERKEVNVDKIPDKPIWDIGEETVKRYKRSIRKAKTLVVNGPSGVLEQEEFSYGTKEILTAVSEAPGLSVIGGGETVGAMHKYGLNADHMSTGGGACLSFLAGERLPVVEGLKEAKRLWDEGFFMHG